MLGKVEAAKASYGTKCTGAVAKYGEVAGKVSSVDTETLLAVKVSLDTMKVELERRLAGLASQIETVKVELPQAGNHDALELLKTNGKEMATRVHTHASVKAFNQSLNAFKKNATTHCEKRQALLPRQPTMKSTSLFSLR